MASIPLYSATMSAPISITAFYLFTPLSEERLDQLQAELLNLGNASGMRGLTLLAPEGINGTVCGSAEAIADWKAHLTALFGPIVFKDSTAARLVFKRWSVKKKPEIVGLKRPDIRPQGPHRHLTPQQWHEMLSQEDVVVLDARNEYEVEIGKFKGAIDPKLESFQDFPEFAKQKTLPEDKKILMYCTGGIRCEKALLALEEEGYKEVYQLEGGILAYLAQFPHQEFEGECFVFDQRTSVDQELQPSQRYAICPHCGQPAEHLIQCAECKVEQKICTKCSAHEERRTCSKRCANEYKEAALLL